MVLVRASEQSPTGSFRCRPMVIADHTLGQPAPVHATPDLDEAGLAHPALHAVLAAFVEAVVADLQRPLVV